jgi:hypothetical protein
MLMTVDLEYTRDLSVRGRGRGGRGGGGDVQDEPKSGAVPLRLGGCYRPGFITKLVWGGAP